MARGEALEETEALHDAIERRIREFDDIDRRATSFRYPVEQNGNPPLGVPLYDGELLQVKGVVDALEYYLAGISCGVHETSSQICEALEYCREREAEYAWEMRSKAVDYGW